MNAEVLSPIGQRSAKNVEPAKRQRYPLSRLVPRPTESKPVQQELPVREGKRRIVSRAYREVLEHESRVLEQEKERLDLQLIPPPISKADQMSLEQQSRVLQGMLSMVKDSPKQQALLGVETTAISLASTAFILGIPAAIFPGGQAIKLLLDTTVAIEAYQLLQTPDAKARVKELPWNVLKNPLMLLGGVATQGILFIDDMQNRVQSRKENKKARRAFAQLHPEITSRKQLQNIMTKRNSELEKIVWLKALQQANPHVSKETVVAFGERFLTLLNVQCAVLQKDSNVALQATAIPIALYFAAFGVGLLVFPAPLIAGLVASGVAGIARSISYARLKHLKQEMQKRRPEEFITVQA